MTQKLSDRHRIAIWRAMADHFLDTETRQDVPITALVCVEAGCTLKQARDIWRFEVSPAVEFNVWCVAGEWAGWDEDWLVSRIERFRDTKGRQPRWLRQLCYWSPVHCMENVWRAIENVMEELLGLPSSSEREQRAKDLTFLARHQFDFCPDAVPAPGTVDRARLDSLYPEPFSRLMAPVIVPGEFPAAHAQLMSAFGEKVGS